MNYNIKRQDLQKKFSKKWQKHTDILDYGVVNIIEGYKNFLRKFEKHLKKHGQIATRCPYISRGT